MRTIDFRRAQFKKDRQIVGIKTNMSSGKKNKYAIIVRRKDMKEYIKTYYEC